jgi:hypothetical protein
MGWVGPRVRWGMSLPWLRPVDGEIRSLDTLVAVSPADRIRRRANAGMAREGTTGSSALVIFDETTRPPPGRVRFWVVADVIPVHAAAIVTS